MKWGLQIQERKKKKKKDSTFFLFLNINTREVYYLYYVKLICSLVFILWPLKSLFYESFALHTPCWYLIAPKPTKAPPPFGPPPFAPTGGGGWAEPKGFRGKGSFASWGSRAPPKHPGFASPPLGQSPRGLGAKPHDPRDST